MEKDGVIINGARVTPVTQQQSAVATRWSSLIPICARQFHSRVRGSGCFRTADYQINKRYLNVYPNPIYRDGYLNIERSLINADKGILVNISDLNGRIINSRFLKPDEKD